MRLPSCSARRLCVLVCAPDLVALPALRLRFRRSAGGVSLPLPALRCSASARGRRGRSCLLCAAAAIIGRCLGFCFASWFLGFLVNIATCGASFALLLLLVGDLFRGSPAAVAVWLR